jgi:hypothetical protein
MEVPQMFRTQQIVTSTQLIRRFRELSNYIEESHLPLLVSQKGGQFLVVVAAEVFEDLMIARIEQHSAGFGAVEASDA